MLCYLAGGSSEASLVASYIAKLKAANIPVSLDWASQRLVEIEKAGGQITDTLHSSEERTRIAIAERDAVARCDVQWLLMPERASFGCGWEAGYFYGLMSANHSVGRLAIVSGPWKNSIFTELMGARFDSHEEGFKFLCDRPR